MLDSISDTLGDIADAVGGAAGGDACIGEPVFTNGRPIDEDATGDTHAHSLEEQMEADAKPIEFIHFGKVHPDDGTRFEHAAMSDLDRLDPETLGDCRAIMFRAGLVRETLLLDGFIASAKEMMDSIDQAKGGLADIADTAMGLMSGGGAGTAPPDTAELDRMRSDVAIAGGKVNTEKIEYAPVHAAGVALHQARADYTKFCTEFLEPFYVTKDGGGSGGGGGLMETVGGFTGGLPGDEVMQTVTGILFKAYDISLAMYLRARKVMEPAIEDASYDLTIRQISQRRTPVFPAWFKAPELDADDDQQDSDENKSDLEKLISPVTDAMDKAKAEAEQKKQQFQEFFGTPPEPTFGDESLATALASLPKASAEYLQAFRVVLLDGGDLPNFVKVLVEKLAAINAETLDRVLRAIHQKGPTTAVPQDALLELGREALYHQILVIAGELVPFLNMLTDEDAKLVNLSGVGGVGASDLANLGIEQLDKAIGPGVNHIVELTMADLGARLEAIRDIAKDTESPTMEPYLSRTPMMLTVMTRNTIFPLWELLFETLFGKVGAIMTGVVSPMESMLGKPADSIGKAKDKVDEANEKISNVTDNIPTSIDEKDIAAFASDPKKGLDNAFGGDDNGNSDDESATPPAEFPGSTRLDIGDGVRITKAQVDQTEPVTVSPS